MGVLREIHKESIFFFKKEFSATTIKKKDEHEFSFWATYNNIFIMGGLNSKIIFVNNSESKLNLFFKHGTFQIIIMTITLINKY